MVGIQLNVGKRSVNKVDLDARDMVGDIKSCHLQTLMIIESDRQQQLMRIPIGDVEASSIVYTVQLEQQQVRGSSLIRIERSRHELSSIERKIESGASFDAFTHGGEVFLKLKKLPQR